MFLYTMLPINLDNMYIELPKFRQHMIYLNLGNYDELSKFKYTIVKMCPNLTTCLNLGRIVTSD